MNTVVPVAIVLSLGISSGLILRRRLSGIWITSIVAGIVATLLWGLGMEVLFQIADFEQERGATHYEGILVVFLAASLASLAALSLIKIKNTNV